MDAYLDAPWLIRLKWTDVVLPPRNWVFRGAGLGLANEEVQPGCVGLQLPCALDRGVCVCEVAQSCPTLCDPVDCSPPGSSVHGILQAKNTGVGCHFLHWTEVDPHISPISCLVFRRNALSPVNWKGNKLRVKEVKCIIQVTCSKRESETG